MLYGSHWRDEMDLIYVASTLVMGLALAGLVYACAALESKA